VSAARGERPTWRAGSRFSADPAMVARELRVLHRFTSVRDQVRHLREHEGEFPTLWGILPTDADSALYELQVATLHQVYTSLDLEVDVTGGDAGSRTITVRAFPSNPDGRGYVEISRITEADDRRGYIDSIERRINGLRRELSDTQDYFERRGYEFPERYGALRRDLEQALVSWEGGA